MYTCIVRRLPGLRDGVLLPLRERHGGGAPKQETTYNTSNIYRNIKSNEITTTSNDITTSNDNNL